MALKELHHRVKGQCVHLFIDNTTALSCIKKGGSLGSIPCDDVTQAIYAYAWKHEITFKLSYCPTKLNVEADRASRAFASSAEWTLSPSTQQTIFGIFPKPKVDLFATYNNAICKQYISLHYEENAIATDAFTCLWRDSSLIFPPFSIIGRTLRKIKEDKTKGILVVPNWTTQPWYASLTKLRHFHRRLQIPITQETRQWPEDPSKTFPLAGRSHLLAIPI